MTRRELSALAVADFAPPPRRKQSKKRPNIRFLFPEVFKNAGYQTFGTGKWHNGPKLIFYSLRRKVAATC